MRRQLPSTVCVRLLSRRIHVASVAVVGLLGSCAACAGAGPDGSEGPAATVARPLAVARPTTPLWMRPGDGADAGFVASPIPGHMAPAPRAATPDPGRPIRPTATSPSPPAEPTPSSTDRSADHPAVLPSVESPPAAVGQVDGFRVDIEAAILAHTNEARRREAGLPPLAPEAELVPVARAHGADMIERGFFDHVNPDGLGPAERIAVGHRRLIGMTGENIWMATGMRIGDADALAAEIVDDWMNSPGHRANILRDAFTHLGVGVVVRGAEIQAVQNFAGVRAYLRAPLPLVVSVATTLELAADAFPAGLPAAERYTLSPLGIDDPGSTPLRIGEPLPDTAPGVYQLRMWFRTDGRRFEIAAGPTVRVR